MAKTKKKNFYYVLVLTNEGPVFVTDVDNSTKTAHWKKDKAPKELGQYQAEDLAFGLMCNLYSAYAVKVPIELDKQPYLYDKGRFEWKWNKDDKKDEQEDK